MFNSFKYDTMNYNTLLKWAGMIVVNLIVNEALPLTTDSQAQGVASEPEAIGLSTISQTVILG